MRLLLVAALALLAGPAFAADPIPTPDYADPGTWACLPGRADLCAADLSTTVVAANGTMTREDFTPAPDPKIDCFYVYPTVSNDPGGNSDMSPGVEERHVIAQQFARFGSVCRLYAPLYRQVTVTALRALLAGRPIPSDGELAYADVKAAWDEYLAHHNEGRGVILIGHSQGAGVLTALIAREIDGAPVEKQLVAAYLLGSNVAVPRGARVGGVFADVPLCERASETGCVVSYVSFRDGAPPPPGSRFGALQTTLPLPLPAGVDLTAACVNPAALLRGRANAPLQSYLTAQAPAQAPPIVWATGKTVSTPFVAVPGLLSAQCRANATHSWLAVHVNADPADPRADDIRGDIVAGGQTLPDWGLHLVDVNLEMGDLVELAERQSVAFDPDR
jgi:pimeloyl-ACP methyl ester carboxylesterase